MFVLYGLLAVAVILLTEYLRRRRKRLPPGPRGVPILGNLLQMHPKASYESFAKIAWKYGPVCGLQLGSVYTVLLSDPKLISQLFAKDTFSGRAPLWFTHGIMNGYGLIAAEGELWKSQRIFVSVCLKNFGMVKFPSPKRDKLEKKILLAVDESIEKIEARSKGIEGFNPHLTLRHCLGNLMNNIVFGKTYEEDDEFWKWLQHVQEEGIKHMGDCEVLNCLPFLRFLPRYRNTLQLILDGQNKTHEHYREILEDHRKCPTEENSILAAFDNEMKKCISNGEPLGSFTETQCVYLLADLYGAGVDTTLTTLRWFLLFMAAFPIEQVKIQEEILNAVGESDPTLEHRASMIRLEAAIMEVQRLRSVVPTGIPHGTTEDTRIGDYDVPKGTMILPLQWAIHMNPSYWSDPQKFKPERFITEDGNLTKPDTFLPFQRGKRMCVGDELARMVLILFSARILHRFRISALPGQTIDLEGEYSLMLVPKPHRLLFKPRR